MSAELEKWLHSSSSEDRMKAAKAGYKPEELVNDPDWFIPLEIASKGLCLQELSQHSNSSVRYTVAQQGHNPDAFKDDTFTAIREMIAEDGHCLDHFLKDESASIRMIVLNHGHRVDVLAKDEDISISSKALLLLPEWEAKNASLVMSKMVSGEGESSMSL